MFVTENDQNNEYVAIYIATPYGITNHLHVPVCDQNSSRLGHHACGDSSADEPAAETTPNKRTTPKKRKAATAGTINGRARAEVVEFPARPFQGISHSASSASPDQSYFDLTALDAQTVLLPTVTPPVGVEQIEKLGKAIERVENLILSTPPVPPTTIVGECEQR